MSGPTTMKRRWALWVILGVLALGATGCPRGGQLRPNWLQIAPEATLRQLAEADARAQRDLGLHLLLEAGDAEAAEAALVTATERAAGDPLSWLALGVLRIEYGRPSEGMAALGEGIERALAAAAEPRWCVAPGVEPAPRAEDCQNLALIIEEAAARLLRETDYTGRAQILEGLLERHEGALSYAAAFHLRRALEHDARVAGDAEAAARHLSASGALLRWRVIGPFGPHPNQSFDIEHAPEGDSRLGERYDLGPGRGELETWEPQLSSSSIQLRSALGRSGTWYAETFVQAAESSEVDLRLWAPPDTAVSVTVGGVPVLLRDERLRFEPAVTTGRVRLRGGAPTRVLVKLSSSTNDPGFSLGLRDGAGRPLETVEAGSGSGRPVEVVDLLGLLAPASGESISPLRAFVTSLYARARSFWPVAEEALWRVSDPAPLLLSMRAEASGSTPTMPRSIQEDRLLSGMRETLEGDGGLWRARLVVARSMASENQGREALDLLRQGIDEQPQNASLWHELGSMARRLGLQPMATEALDRAVTLDSRSCGSLYELVMMYHDVGLTEQRERALDRLMACDATARTRAQLLSDTGRVDLAFNEMLRLQALDEYPAGLDAEIADLAMSLGQTDRARELLNQLLGRWPRAESYVSALADLDGANQGRAAAAERLTDALGRYPWEMSGLRRVSAVLGAEREYEDWRVDGLEQIRRFTKAQVRYDAPNVFVLDRAVYRVYPDLSSLELVHQITKVTTQEALGAASEFNTPRGAEVLTLRTIKPDGTILEPLSYDADETTNLAGVEVGDFVEWEYIVSRGPSRIYPGGLQTPRFYFATPDTAMHLSELIVLLPEGLEADFVPRGPSPPEPEPITLGDLRGFRFAAEQVPSQVREPNMPSPNEVFPSIGVVSREDARLAVAAWSDSLVAGMRADWRMERLLRELRQPGQTEVELARALYDYVLDHVQHGRGGTTATSTLATGHGDALQLYVALLRLAGLSPDIVYAWTLAADRSGPYLVPGELSVSLVRVDLDDEPWWIHLGSRHAPFGHLPASVRGQPALIAGREPSEVQVPESSRHDDLVENRAEGVIGADGTIEAEVLERFLGVRAAEFRTEVSRIPASERSQRGAAMLGHQYPGAIAEGVQFSGVDERHDPLEVRARLASRMLGRREGAALLLPARLSQASPYSGLARLSERRTALVFDDELHEVIEQTLRLPTGARVDQPCPEASRTLGSASFTVRCSVEGDQLTHSLEIHLPPQRIAPEHYREFAEFLRAYDEAAASETRVILQ